MKIDYLQMDFIHPTLKALLTWLEQETGVEYTITSIYREGDSGVHGQIPVRGIDLRIRNKALGAHIVDLINDNWQYDNERPGIQCAIAHGKGYSFHIHTQVHKNTMEIT